MKEKPTDHVHTDHDIDSENEDKDWPELNDDKNVPRNLEAGKKQKWYNVIDFKKMIPLLPILKRVRGSKKNITIPVFTELNDSMQSVFEQNKSAFRFRTQVDLLAYYWGARVLEQIYFVYKGLPVSKLSKLLEFNEKSYQVRDDMKTVKELFQKDIEFSIDGLINEEELYNNWTRYLETFDNAVDRKRMEQVMERMLDFGEYKKDPGEFKKAKDRLRKRAEYNRAKFKVIDNE